MASDNPRLPLGDRISVSHRRWLTRFALRLGCCRADALETLLAACRANDDAGRCPLELLQQPRPAHHSSARRQTSRVRL